MIECKLCGFKSKCRIISHLVKVHKYDVYEYKLKYGPVVTDEYKRAVSERAVKKWKDKEYRDKTNLARNNSWTDEKRKNQSEITKQSYKNGFKNWCDGLTKDTDVRVRKLGEFNKKNLSGRTKDTHDYLKKHSEYMKLHANKYWGKAGILRKYFEDHENFDKWREKISNTISDLYKSGKLEFGNGIFKSGYYNNIFYASSLELKCMQWLDGDEHIKSWSRNFDVIEYMDKNGKCRRYLPDFKVIVSTGDIVVIETKGFPDEDLDEKTIYARNKYKNYFVCYSVEEVKNKIYEVIDNQKNNKI